MRRPIKKEHILEPDLKHSSLLVAQIINNVMQDGKKAVATRIVYNALDLIEEKTKKPSLEVLQSAIDNAGPSMALKSRRIGGANYQVPVEVKPERKMTLAIRWIIEAARAGKGKAMEEKLAEEIMNALNNTGGAVKKRNDTHRMAEANKAFAHFAW